MRPDVVVVELAECDRTRRTEWATKGGVIPAGGLFTQATAAFVGIRLRGCLAGLKPRSWVG